MHELAATYRAPILVTLAYVAVYYVTIINVLRVKTRLFNEYKARNEKFDRYYNTDRAMLAADRGQLNMLEHMPAFLTLLWLAALSASPTRAAIAGCVYLVTRVAYPFLLGGHLGRNIRPRLLVATFTGYGVLVFLAAESLWACLG